jgi:hypothetical protein
MPHPTTRLLLPLLLLAGCASLRVRTEYDPAAAPDMASYRTYAWYGASGPAEEEAAQGGSGTPGGPLLRGVLRSEVQSQLEQRGFRPAAPGESPDFRVAWHGSISPEVQVVPLGSPYPWGPWVDPWYVGGMGAGATTTSEQGRLVLDVVDARTGKLAWRGTAEGPVDTGSIRFEQKVRQAVGELMERFPPRP